MKRLAFLLFVAASASVFAQKPIKPNVNKALASLQAGKVDEAKANIDAAITNEKMMTDPKTWYYRGLIYSSIDTTSNEAIHNLDPNAFQVALEAFNKAEELAKGKPLSITDANGLPVLKTQQMAWWANSHINDGAAAFQEDNYEAALKAFENVQKILPNDTTAYFYGGIAANSAENFDKSAEYFEKYVALGGSSPDAYKLLGNVYSGPKQDKEKALELMRTAKAKFPNDTDFPKVEIGLLIDLKRIDEAKSGLEKQLVKEPDNKILHFYLGYANSSLNNTAEAKKNYERALQIDPNYFEAAQFLAKLMYADAAAIKKEMSNLGITPADKKKRLELDGVLVGKLKEALPYWERAEKINPNDQDTLDALYSIYGDLDMQDQVKRIEKRYKELGYE
jgi:tetratricopeptide (TPR) repeat protein